MTGESGLIQLIQEAIYKARWVDGIKDAKLVTDEELAKAVGRALGWEGE